MVVSAAIQSLQASPWLPVAIFVARVTDVSIGTIRLIAVTRGQRAMAVILGFFEVFIWVLAVSSVIGQLDQWANILAYCLGFAAGNAVGMCIEKRLAVGTQVVSLISRGTAQAVAAGLRFASVPVITLDGSGRDGPLSLCMAIIPRRQTATVLRIARSIDPDVIATVENLADCSVSQARRYLPGKIPALLGSPFPRSHGHGRSLMKSKVTADGTHDVAPAA